MSRALILALALLLAQGALAAHKADLAGHVGLDACDVCVIGHGTDHSAADTADTHPGPSSSPRPAVLRSTCEPARPHPLHHARAPPRRA